MYGGAARPTSPLDMIIRSTSTRSAVFQWVYHHDGGGGEEAHSPCEEACGKRRLQRPSSLSVGFSYGCLQHVGTPRLGAIVEQVVPYEYIRELLGFQKGAPEQVDEHGGTLEGFWSMIVGEAHQQRNSIRDPIIQVFHSWMCKRILGRMRDKDNQHGV
jgi:hypothetical protein